MSEKNLLSSLMLTASEVYLVSREKPVEFAKNPPYTFTFLMSASGDPGFSAVATLHSHVGSFMQSLCASPQTRGFPSRGRGTQVTAL